MWWHIKIKRKYIYVFQLLSPFFTLYKILCVLYVCERESVSYESLMSITMVQCSIKVKSKGQQTCYKKTHKMSPFCPNLVFLQTQSAASSSLNGFHSDFQSWSTWGLSHGADYASLSREMLRRFIKKQKKKAPVFRCAYRKHSPCDHFIQCNYDQIRFPPRSLSLTHCRTNQRKSCTVSCLKQQHRFCAIDLYDRYC